MKFRFAGSRLKRLAEDSRASSREWGPTVAHRLVMRISAIAAASSVTDLYRLPGRFHPLTGDRRGQYAFDLSGNMRLVISLEDNERVVVILSVEDYH